MWLLDTEKNSLHVLGLVGAARCLVIIGNAS